jgi:predicted peptidase
MKMECTRIVLAIALAAVGAGCASAGRRSRAVAGQSPQSLEARTETGKTVRVRYLLYLPPLYAESDERWPLMLFLHGAGERGADLEKVKIHGPPKLIAAEGKDFPFVIVSPQCPEDGWWSDEVQIETLDALLDHIVDRYRIDQHRIYVTGLSMGGFGVWRMAARYPDRFAAIAPICGGGDPKDAASIRHLPVWAFHGAEDKVVAVERSQEMVDALEKAGGDVTFTVYPQAGHDSWTQTYDDPELYEWFLKHRRSENK